MTTLRILELDGYFAHIDLYENDPINIKYQYSDVEKINEARGSFSQTFRVPATQNNIDIFGHLFDVNYTGSFNVKKKTRCFIEVDTMPIVRGFFQLKNIYITKGKFSDFEIAFFGESIELSKTLLNKKLSELDLSDFDHTCDTDNITDSFTGDLFSGQIRYGLIDKGQNWGQTTGNPLNVNNPIYAAEWTPFIRVKTLVEQIFVQNDFQLESDFFDNIDNHYTPCSKQSRFVQTETSYDDYKFKANIGTTYNVTAAGQYTPTLVEEYDPAGVITGNSFVAPHVGYYFMRFKTSVVNNGSSSITFNVVLKNITTGIVVETLNPNITLSAGDSITVFANPTIFFGNTNAYAMTFNVQGGSVDVDFTTDTYWKLEQANPPLYGQTVSIANNLPDITQMDYLRSLQAMYNLVFIPDRNDERIIKVEPFIDYISSGEIKDWTGKVDTDKDIVISPTTDIQAKEYEWTFTADKDYLNQLYVTQTQRVYGRYLIQDSENDFATGKNTIQPKFGAYPCTFIDGTDIIIHKQVDNQGVITNPLCKVVYWGGVQPVAEGVLYINDGTSTELTEYPYFNHYSTTDVEVDDIDLNFGGEIPAFPIISNPSANLYDRYWRDWVNQLYSENSRILTAYFNLNVIDVGQFRFNDQIFIKDSYWRILEMNYSPNSNDLTQVKLIKLLTGANICDLTPIETSGAGLVGFVDADGDPATPTRVCCEAYGYVFINDQCWQPLGNIAPNYTYEAGTAPYSFAQGNYTSEGVFNLLLGNDLSNTGNNAVMFGENLLNNYDNAQVSGSNAYGFTYGVHRGAGWWYESYLVRGVSQGGTIYFIYEGSFDDDDEVELFIEGRENERLSIPDNCGMSVRFDVSITTFDTSTGRAVDSQTMVFYDMFKKIAGTASNNYGSHTNTPVVTLGDWGTSTSQIHLDVDTTTNTSQHRIILHNQSVSNTNQTRIICALSYTMAKY